MIPASVLIKMATIGLSPEQAEAVAGMLSEVEAATLSSADEKQEAGKERARARWRRWKANQTTANDGKRLQTTANVSKPLTRAEDSSSNLSSSGSLGDVSPSARPSKGTRLPDEFQPDTTWAVEQGLPLPDAKHEAAQFCDYWRSKPGKDGVKLDWPGTWRMWVRNSLKRHRSPPSRQANAPPPSKQTVGQQARDELRRMGMLNDAPGTQNRHDNESDRGPGFAGTGIARRIAIAAGR